MASLPAANLRRNGAQKSCERCRKMKVRCDHGMPKCSRCVGKHLECVYEAAPMTRHFRPARFDASSGRLRTTMRAYGMPGRSGSVARQSQSQGRSSQGQSHSPTGQTPRILDSTPPGGPGPPTPTPAATQPVEITISPDEIGGFAGPGSYRSLTTHDGSMPQSSSDYPGAAGSPGTTTHSIDRKRLDLGLQILDFVHEYRVLLRNLMLHIYRVIRMPVVPHKVMLPAVDSLCRLIDDEVAANDANHDDDAKLRTVIHLFQSSYQAIPGTKLTTPSQVWQSIAGENLRWETIGNIIAMASLCLVHIHDRDLALLDPEKRSKNDLIPPFHGITDGIMTLTSASPVVNELVVCLKYNHLLLAFHRFGDSSHHVYSIFMELASSVYATGMHQDRTISSGPADHPGFMHQWRRRCFTAIFSLDKTVATILGRPPIIHRHYCVLDAPLDLEDDDLTGPQCENELQKLDQNGWNTDGRRRSTSYMRLRYLLAMLREEALELLLGSSVGPPDRAQAVLQRLRAMWDSCPSNMKYSTAVTSSAALSPHDTWFLLGFYIDYLYSTFLVFRSKTQQDQSPETLEMLLFAAKDVLSTVLIFNEQRELLREVRSDFSAVFLPYGLPCADVLATELLRRSSPFHYPGGAGSGGPHLPRSEVIRELTVYVSCLGWVPRRGSHNSKFCKEVQARLTRVLDQIIDAPLAHQPEETLPDVGEPEGDGGQSHAMPGYPGQVASNLNPFLIDLETGMFLDSQLDLFSQALL